jgi:hemerythrin
MDEKVEWSDTYLLGIPEIDNQHKKLIAIANELYEVITGDQESYKANMAKALKKLVDYTVYHFSHEEGFMRDHGYAGVDVHKTAHDGFINEVNHQVKQLEGAESRSDGKKFYSYMVNWILTHIARADKVWAAFVKKNM